MLSLPGRRPFAANFIPLALFGGFVAVGVQILQLFLPARDAVLSDVVWNLLGMGLGAWMTTLPPVRRALHGPAELRFDVGSEEHTSELQSLMRISYAGFCFEKKTNCITAAQ